MSRTVGAGKKVQLSVKTSGIDDGEAAEIQVFKAKDDSTLDTLSSKVKNKVISAEWTAKGPEPEDEEQSWEVYYKAKCKGLETKACKLVVYCDWVEVSSVDEQDAALPDAIFRVTAGQESRVRNTGSSGVRKEEHLPVGPIEVEWLPPFKLVEWVDEKGPKRKAKVKKVPRAELVWPPEGAHTQWVNLPEDDAKPEQGSKVKLRVTLVGGKAGDKVYAKVEYGEDNSERNDPAPGFVGGTTADWCPDGGIEGELAGDADQPDHEAVLELELGKAGGDVTVVSVGGDQECKDQTVTITNWRKLYYQVTRAAGSTMPALDVLQAALDDVFIEYEQYDEVLVAEGDLPEGSFVDAADLRLRGSGKRLVAGDHNLDQLKAKFQDDKTPVGAHVIVCEAQYDGGAPGSWHEQTLEVEAINPTKTVLIADNVLYDVFRTAIQDGQPSLQPGSTWESMAPGGHPDSGKRGDLTADMLSFALPGTPDKVQVTLPPEAAQLVGDGAVPPGAQATDAAVKHKVKLTLKLRVARGPFFGEAIEQHQLVVRMPSDPAMNGVMVHELGHAIKALVAAPPGLDASAHGRDYTENGHQGHHCADGLSDADFNQPDYMAAEAKGACVMWGGGTENAEEPINDGKFCERCRAFVLAEACDAIDSPGGKGTVTRKQLLEEEDALAGGGGTTVPAEFLCNGTQHIAQWIIDTVTRMRQLAGIQFSVANGVCPTPPTLCPAELHTWHTDGSAVHLTGLGVQELRVAELVGLYGVDVTAGANPTEKSNRTSVKKHRVAGSPLRETNPDLASHTLVRAIKGGSTRELHFGPRTPYEMDDVWATVGTAEWRLLSAMIDADTDYALVKRFWWMASLHRQWGHRRMIDWITGLAHFYRAQTGVRIGIGDVSHIVGETQTDHGSHQLGEDVDLYALEFPERTAPTPAWPDMFWTDRSGGNRRIRRLDVPTSATMPDVLLPPDLDTPAKREALTYGPGKSTMTQAEQDAVFTKYCTILAYCLCTWSEIDFIIWDGFNSTGHGAEAKRIADAAVAAGWQADWGPAPTTVADPGDTSGKFLTSPPHEDHIHVRLV